MLSFSAMPRDARFFKYCCKVIGSFVGSTSFLAFFSVFFSDFLSSFFSFFFFASGALPLQCPDALQRFLPKSLPLYISYTSSSPTRSYTISLHSDAKRRDQDSPPIWIEAPPGWRLSSRSMPGPDKAFSPSTNFTPYPGKAASLQVSSRTSMTSQDFMFFLPALANLFEIWKLTAMHASQRYCSGSRAPC